MESPNPADIRRMLSGVKYQRCCGGVISRHLGPLSLATIDAKLPVLMIMRPLGLRWRLTNREFSGLRKVLDHVEQHDDVHVADYSSGLRRRCLAATQPLSVTIRGRFVRQFDASNFEMMACFLKRKSIGVPELQEFTAARKPRMKSTVPANSRRSTASAPR